MKLQHFSLRFLQFAKEIRDELNSLDGQVGDGDLGNSIVNGANALHVTASKVSSIQEWFKVGGVALRQAAPSTIGILLSSALIKASKIDFHKQDIIEYWIKVQEVMINEIKTRGGAEKGDKTILDSLIPAYYAFKESKDESIVSALEQAYISAKLGAEKTKGMKSKTGRSSWLGERASEHIDGGAWFCYLTYEFIYNLIKENKEWEM